MTADELREVFSPSRVVSPKVKVQGYITGFEARNFPNSKVKNGMLEHDRGDKIWYVANITFPEGMTMSFHQDGFGTNVEYHKMGGGQLYIPIEHVELVK